MKQVLDFVGITPERVRGWCVWAACWCEQRRTWLNEIGEEIWRQMDPEHYRRQRLQFCDIVCTALQVLPLTEASVCDILSQNMNISRHTMNRWLTEMVNHGVLSEMHMNGNRWLTLR